MDEIMVMSWEETELRMAQINDLLGSPEANVEELRKEVDALEERRKQLKENEEARKALAAKIANGNEPVVVENIPVVEGRKMVDIKEFRNSKAYVDAYAEYIKTGKDEELRSLLTENVGDGTIAVPDIVYDTVKTAWDKNEIMSLVNKTEIAGNIKINFEISGTDAVIHTEGSGPIAEEELVEGIAEIKAAYVKKWISVSDEVMSMRGQAFLEYIYKELAYKIVKKMADQLVSLIAALPTVATATTPNAAAIKEAPSMATVSKAISNLSDEADNPVIIMNKLTWGEFKSIQYANNYAEDPFEGLTVKFNNSLPSYAAASENDVYMIVGDLRQGAIANFPNGEDVEYVFDELTRKKEDLVEVLGKEFVGLGIVACKAFTNVTKPAQA